MFQFDQLERIHLELTDKCNAGCPMCGRNWYGGVENENLPLTELGLEDIKKILPEEILIKLKEVYVCGNFGDALMAKDTLAIFQYMRQANPELTLGMFTNGSGRTAKWWSELGKVLSGDKGYCRFSLDGLRDTNHLYRKYTDWDRIMTSAESFISSGGNAIWEFIVFKHNQHQVNTARLLAKKMGFKKFQIIQSGRFLQDSGIMGVGWKNAHPVYSKDGNYEYCIQPATKISKPSVKEGLKQIILAKPSLRNIFTILRGKQIVHFPKTFDRESERNPGLEAWNQDNITHEHYFDNHCIECKAQQEKSLYINPQGYVTPCCWTGYTLYSERDVNFVNQMKDIYYHMNLDEINALKRPLKHIFESDFIQNKFTDGWNKKSYKDGQLLVCSKYCGETRSTVKDEYAIEADILNT